MKTLIPEESRGHMKMSTDQISNEFCIKCITHFLENSFTN